eukprot:15783-Rhodomonas_salina.1
MVPSTQTTPAAAKLDLAGLLAIRDIAGWEATLQRDDLASKRGRGPGWGLTPGEGAADPAFYAAYAGFLRGAQSGCLRSTQHRSSPPLTFAPPPTGLSTASSAFMTPSCLTVPPACAPSLPAPAWTL